MEVRMRLLPAVAILLAVSGLSTPVVAEAAPELKRCRFDRTFLCGRVSVPLDWSGREAGRIRIHVAVDRADRSVDKPLLLTLSGGPGQATSSVARLIRQSLKPLLSKYRVVAVDQRGTGFSGHLDCAGLRTYRNPTKGVRACGRELGPRRAFYTTDDSVRDLDAVRAAFGAEQTAIFGVSYGTYVATRFASRYPDRTSAMVLDSLMSHDSGPPVFELTGFEAIPRIVRDLCAADACAGVTTDPVADLAAVVGALKSRRVEPKKGEEIEEWWPLMEAKGELLLSLIGSDFNVPLRAALPAALAASRHGDREPLGRLFVYSLFGGLFGRKDADPGAGGFDNRREAPRGLRSDRTRAVGSYAKDRAGLPPDFSDALYLATVCADAQLPWSPSTPISGRVGSIAKAMSAIPDSAIFPFDRATAAGAGAAGTCRHWPATSIAPPEPVTSLPDVPTLILNGKADLRTTAESALREAALLPHAGVVLVPHQGHSVLSSRPTGKYGTFQCVRKAMELWVEGNPVGDPCGSVTAAVPVQPVPPPTFRSIVPPPNVPGRPGRTLKAVQMTLDDAIWSVVVNTPDVETEWPTEPMGLRAGSMSGQRNKVRLKATLDGYTFARGARVDGSIRVADGRMSGTVEVWGRRAAEGELRFMRDGSIEGTLDGVEIDIPPAAAASAADRRGRRDLLRAATTVTASDEIR